jgi:hypothetical protein
MLITSSGAVELARKSTLDVSGSGAEDNVSKVKVHLSFLKGFVTALTLFATTCLTEEALRERDKETDDSVEDDGDRRAGLLDFLAMVNGSG